MKNTIKTGLALGIGAGVIGVLPTTTPAAANIKTQSLKGISKAGTVLPTLGALEGTGMVVDQTRKLNKKNKRLFKKKYSL